MICLAFELVLQQLLYRVQYDVHLWRRTEFPCVPALIAQQTYMHGMSCIWACSTTIVISNTLWCPFVKQDLIPLCSSSFKTSGEPWSKINHGIHSRWSCMVERRKIKQMDILYKHGYNTPNVSARLKTLDVMILATLSRKLVLIELYKLVLIELYKHNLDKVMQKVPKSRVICSRILGTELGINLVAIWSNYRTCSPLEK